MIVRKPRGPALFVLVAMAALAGCAGTIIESTTDVALALAKAPFKVGGAVIDVIAGDDDE